MVNYLIKAVALASLGLLAFLCRTKTTDRRDPRLLGEVALVVLTMLFVSERSWKHHYVTVLLPYSYLVSRILLVACWSAISNAACRLMGGVVCLDGGGVDRTGRFVRRRARPRDRSGLWFVSVGGSRALRDGRLARLGSPLRSAAFGTSPGSGSPFPGLISTRHHCHGRSSRPESRKLIGFLIVKCRF